MDGQDLDGWMDGWTDGQDLDGWLVAWMNWWNVINIQICTF